jgi:hypothetical protein
LAALWQENIIGRHPDHIMLLPVFIKFCSEVINGSIEADQDTELRLLMSMPVLEYKFYIFPFSLLLSVVSTWKQLS